MAEPAQWYTCGHGITLCRDAVLDVLVTGGFELQNDLWDVTVRHPGAHDIAARVAAEDGVAAAEGEKEKRQRYPQARGRRVRNFALEVGGRIGQEALQVWSDLSRQAAWRDGL